MNPQVNYHCAHCGKSDTENPRRRFADGTLLGWCIECEKAHDRKVQEERDKQKIDAGMRRFEVVYYKKLLCIDKVWAKNKDAAKETIYQQLKQEHKDGLTQFTVHQIKEG